MTLFHSLDRAIAALLLSSALILGTATARAHGAGDDAGEHPLSPEDIKQAVAISREVFRWQKGEWLLARISRVVTRLNQDGDEVEVRLYYQWGGEKLARFFCGYDAIERLSCDRAFSGPGAL